MTAAREWVPLAVVVVAAFALGRTVELTPVSFLATFLAVFVLGVATLYAVDQLDRR